MDPAKDTTGEPTMGGKRGGLGMEVGRESCKEDSLDSTESRREGIRHGGTESKDEVLGGRVIEKNYHNT